ncbi:hypothetical protein MUK42_22797 [Musa troglodytarum]|uniref:Uncharacterized protein n=1 Tax=Musa troglodytarum TaxID=320322 RepID=A0A9E7KUG7_9LILI|nr:hypothetical protein MUK42_22797 [Musa troglodytarum]
MRHDGDALGFTRGSEPSIGGWIHLRLGALLRSPARTGVVLPRRRIRMRVGVVVGCWCVPWSNGRRGYQNRDKGWETRTGKLGPGGDKRGVKGEEYYICENTLPPLVVKAGVDSSSAPRSRRLEQPGRSWAFAVEEWNNVRGFRIALVFFAPDLWRRSSTVALTVNPEADQAPAVSTVGRRRRVGSVA